MKKNLFLLMIILTGVFNCAYAEKIPVRVEPTQIISTQRDEVEIGDWIDFEIANDVYLDGKIYIKKGTPVIGIVDFVHENGWFMDAAEIEFKKFITTDTAGKKVEINFYLKINQRLVIKEDFMEVVKHDIKSFPRGDEIYIEPDKKAFTIFIIR